MTTMTNTTGALPRQSAQPRYMPIPASAVPDGVRFDVTQRNQGQMVEVAYGGFCRSEHDFGDPYKRVTDRSERSVEFFKLTREAR